MENEPFVYEKTFNAPASKLWTALTDTTAMQKWYFNIAEFKPEVGFEFEFSAGTDDKQYLHKCRVTNVVPGKKIAYTWQYDGYEGSSEVTFELFEEGGQTKLVLTHTGLESFPGKKYPEFAKESFANGWDYIIGTSLPAFVEK